MALAFGRGPFSCLATRLTRELKLVRSCPDRLPGSCSQRVEGYLVTTPDQTVDLLSSPVGLGFGGLLSAAESDMKKTRPK